jgi:oxygen-independent coproporphyrinogen-3 oxidase
LEKLIPEYVEALCTEVEIISRTKPNSYRVGTIYLGGGTPSLLSTKSIEQIILKLTECFSIAQKLEITVEVNPVTISLCYLKELYQSGVNRLSIGMQSANPLDLHLLERIHDYIDVIIEW